MQAATMPSISWRLRLPQSQQRPRACNSPTRWVGRLRQRSPSRSPQRRRDAQLECHCQRVLAVRSASIGYRTVNDFGACVARGPERGYVYRQRSDLGRGRVNGRCVGLGYVDRGSGCGCTGGLAPSVHVQLHGGRRRSGHPSLDHKQQRRGAFVDRLGQRRMGRAFVRVGHGSGHAVRLGESGNPGAWVLLGDGADYRSGRDRHSGLRVSNARGS